MTTKQMIAVMQAFDEDKEIEYKYKDPKDKNWQLCNNPIWDWSEFDYRIKTKSKYRPYANAEEFLQAQKEHGPYFQILGGRTLFQPSIIGADYITFTIDLELYPEFGKFNFRTQYEKYISMLDNFTWQDGTPCGIIEEEQPC